jgi:hypothetical protein
VEGISQRAAAALARRCLQTVLIDAGGAKENANLDKQIDHVLSKLPPHLADNVDAIRVVGNFAAHPIKGDDPGVLVDVEEDEVDWILSVLRELFAFYYVGPARAEAHRERLNKKLADAGKPPLKRSNE